MQMMRFATFLASASLLAACSDTGSVADTGNGTVPRAAISAEALSVDWIYSVREVTSSVPLFEAEVSAYIGDGEVVFETEDGRDGIALSVENLDPSASEVCHPNGLILDGDCPERADSPYVLFESSPVLELTVNGRTCVAPRDSSAIELRVDDEHHLLRARTIAPVICPGAEARSYEVVLEPIELVKEEGEPTLTLGGVESEPTLVDDEGNPIP
jgi:hypothetical protein